MTARHTVTNRPNPPAAATRWRRPVIAASLALALVACSEHRQMWERHRLTDAEAAVENSTQLHHPITFRRVSEALDIETPPAGHGLSQGQRVDAYRFIKRYLAESPEPLAIVAPPGAEHALGDLRRVIAEAGLNPASITTSRGPRGARSIRLAYVRPIAVPPPCPLWYRDAGREPEKVNYPLFGCATQRNIAGMVANGRDLMGAQPEMPASSERRDRVWSSYVRGAGGSGGSSAADTTTEAKPKDSAKK